MTDKCEDRIDKKYQGRVADLHLLWKAYQAGEEEVEDLGNIFEYGLAFDYVAPGTFQEQRRGYFRYQLSWGGPSDEFRFYTTEGFDIDYVEYWFLDWFDGAYRKVTGGPLALLTELWEWLFKEMGTVEGEYEKARRQRE